MAEEEDPGDADLDLGDLGDLGDGDDLGDLDDLPVSDEEGKAEADEYEPPPQQGITRLDLLEYMMGRDWWASSQYRLFFTIALWMTFATLAINRSGISSSFGIQTGLRNYVEQIVAHPRVSGVKLRTPGESSMACRCGCRHIGGFPQDTCQDDGQTEAFHFYGKLPEDLAADIIGSNGGLYPKGSQDMRPLTWDAINTPEEVLIWLEHGLLPDIWGTVAGKVTRRPGLVLDRNLVIGGVRARQTRSDLNASHCNLRDGLQDWYTISCRGDETATETFGPPATGNLTELNAIPEGARAAFTPSRNAEASSGIFDALFDVERPLADALETATYIRRNGWLTLETNTLELQALMLNAECASFAILNIKFQFSFDGKLHKTMKILVIDAARSEEAQYNVLPEFIWICLIGQLVIEELYSIYQLCRIGEVKKYFRDLWNIIDWFSIVIGLCLIIYTFWIQEQVAEISKTISTFPTSPLSSDVVADKYQDSWSTAIDDALYIYDLVIYRQLCLFWYATIVTVRFLKSFFGQAKLALLQVTLTEGFWDVLHFLIMLVVFFNNFAVGGKILFGSESEDWSTYPRAVASCVVVLMGSPKFDELYAIAPVSATIWYWMFLIIMVFLMMNLLLVIVAENFYQTRRTTGDTQGILSDFKHSWKDFLWRLDWRRDQWSEGEYWACFFSNPYKDLIEGLMEKADVSEEMEQAAESSCLGFRLKRKQQDDLSLEAATPENNPGVVTVASLELRKIGCDALTAEHLLEECQLYVQSEKTSAHGSQLNQVRAFVNMLQQSKEMLDHHCRQLEDGIVEDQEELEDCLERLKGSMEFAFDGFHDLGETGVDSLAPPALGQGGEMKQKLPATMLETIRSDAMLRSTGFGDTPPAIGY